MVIRCLLHERHYLSPCSAVQNGRQLLYADVSWALAGDHVIPTHGAVRASGDRDATYVRHGSQPTMVTCHVSQPNMAT